MKDLSIRQVGIMMIISSIALKFLTFPSLYGTYAGIDGYLSIVTSLVVDLVITGLLLYVSHKNPNKTFHQILKEFLPNWVIKIIEIMLFLMFLFKTIYVIKEYHNYLLDTLFTYMPWIVFLLPLLAFQAFAMNASLRAIGRSMEVLFPIILLGVFMSYALPFKSVDLTNLLPFMENGFGPIVKGGYFCSFSSGDFFILYVILGKFTLEKNAHKKIFGYAAFGALLVFVFYVIFYGVFADLVVTETLAVGDLPLYTSIPANVGRLDWIIINLWTITLLSHIAIFSLFTLQMFNSILGLKDKKISIAVIVSIIFFGTYLLFLNLTQAVEIVTSVPMNNFTIVLLIIPVLLYIKTFKDQLKKNKGNNNARIPKKVFTK